MFSLGEQFLTGVFPRTQKEAVSKGPVDMVYCSHCGLLQLKQFYP